MLKNVAGARGVLAPSQTRQPAWLGMLRLMRPANVVTAYGDILAGCAAAGVAEPGTLALLLAATTGLYGGGVVLNDVFDAKLDAVERPERPIPNGTVSAASAGAFGAMLLAGGILLAYASSARSGFLAMATAAAVLLYDGLGKHHAALGPLNMGLCRGLNLLLGLSAAGGAGLAHWPIALVSVGYIAGVTSLSRGEVRGGSRTAASVSLAWLAAAAAILIVLALPQGRTALFATPFLGLLLYRIGPRFARAIRTLDPMHTRAAVKAGVLSLIVLDSSIAALFAGPIWGAAVLLLYIPATLLSKLFSVT